MLLPSYSNLLCGCCSLFGVLLLILSDQIQYTESAAPIIRLKKHSEGFNTPVAIVDAKDGNKRLYVVERGGIIKTVVRQSGVVKPTPYLDVSSNLGPCKGYCEERGLLGLVFHPDYKTNGYFYINYTSEDSTGVLRTIVSRFSRSVSKPWIADETSELILLSFEQPYSNHNAGDLQFGPDGFLYVTSGDGGYFGDPDNVAQNLSSMLGKILRIDVDLSSAGKNYAIPPTNPFISSTDALPEIWAYGLRNPWKISFDKDNGDLFIADVGQNMYEEINYQPFDSVGGENYGWRLKEGFHCYEPPTDCVTIATLIPPILEYEHVDGACSVTGGYIYRGKNKKLNGSYYYGDYCNGNIWAATMDKNGAWTTDIVKTWTNNYISSFGEDVLGNNYVVSIISGEVYKILPCKDNKKFYFMLEKRTCKFIGKNKKRIDKFCAKQSVFDNCKATCRNPTC